MHARSEQVKRDDGSAEQRSARGSLKSDRRATGERAFHIYICKRLRMYVRGGAHITYTHTHTATVESSRARPTRLSLFVRLGLNGSRVAAAVVVVRA